MLRLSPVRFGAVTSPLFAGVFVINLERRPDRWAQIEAELAKVRGLTALHSVERVTAVDGRAYGGADAVAALEAAGFLSHLGARRLLAPSRDRVWGMDLTPGAVGCALSHVQLWTRIAAAGAAQSARVALSNGVSESEPAFLIVEDDSCFSEDFLEVYADLVVGSNRHGGARVPADWQLLYVGGLDTAHECAQLVVDTGRSVRGDDAEQKDRTVVCRVPQFHRTTHAYVLRPRGACELLRLCLPLTYQVDTMMTMRVAPGRHSAPSTPPYVQSPPCYTLQPPLVTQRSANDSDIQILS